MLFYVLVNHTMLHCISFAFISLVIENLHALSKFNVITYKNGLKQDLWILFKHNEIQNTIGRNCMLHRMSLPVLQLELASEQN
jgi:hypothetical protein